MPKATFWEDYPQLYNFIQSLIDIGLYRKIEDMLSELKGKSILDIGCGTGNIIRYLNPSEYLGIDNNKKYIDFAKDRFENKKYYFLHKDILNDSFPSKDFDAVIILNVLHHLSGKSINILLRKIKIWGRYKKLIIVDGEPTGLFKDVFRLLDAGRHIRSLNRLLLVIKKAYYVNEFIFFTNFLQTYRYLLIRIKN